MNENQKKSKNKLRKVNIVVEQWFVCESQMVAADRWLERAET
jgi:hypothetical protein